MFPFSLPQDVTSGNKTVSTVFNAKVVISGPPILPKSIHDMSRKIGHLNFGKFSRNFIYNVVLHADPRNESRMKELPELVSVSI
jgi:hypothetical protein